MAEELILLLGKDHPEPSRFEVKQISPDIVIGISSVVDKTFKTHNLINNEDACGVYLDDKLLAVMVADSHDGYVTSHEAVTRFPDALKQHGIETLSTAEEIMQAYLNTVLNFSSQLLFIGKQSGIIYERNGYHPIEDFSSSTFESIIRINGNYFTIGLGDSYTAIIRKGNVIAVKPKCPHFIGSTNLWEKIRQKAFNYEEKHREVSDLFNNMALALNRDETLNRDEKKARAEELWGKEYAAQNALSKEYESTPYPDMSYTQEHVRKVVPVHKLDVIPGDIIFQCTDGIELDMKGIMAKRDKTPAVYIGNVFSKYPLYEAVYKIFEGIQKREFSIDWDNVAITAIRVV